MKYKDKLPKNTPVIVNPGRYYRQPQWEKDNGLWTGGPASRNFTQKVKGTFRFSSPDNGPWSKIVEINGEYIEVDKSQLNPILSGSNVSTQEEKAIEDG